MSRRKSPTQNQIEGRWGGNFQPVGGTRRESLGTDSLDFDRFSPFASCRGACFANNFLHLICVAQDCRQHKIYHQFSMIFFPRGARAQSPLL